MAFSYYLLVIAINITNPVSIELKTVPNSRQV